MEWRGQAFSHISLHICRWPLFSLVKLFCLLPSSPGCTPSLTWAYFLALNQSSFITILASHPIPHWAHWRTLLKCFLSFAPSQPPMTCNWLCKNWTETELHEKICHGHMINYSCVTECCPFAICERIKGFWSGVCLPKALASWDQRNENLVPERSLIQWLSAWAAHLNHVRSLGGWKKAKPIKSEYFKVEHRH